MNVPAPGLVPPRPGIEKEEPEFAHEDDIPRSEPHPDDVDEPIGQHQPPERE
jgi:hypothetical protein